MISVRPVSIADTIAERAGTHGDFSAVAQTAQALLGALKDAHIPKASLNVWPQLTPVQREALQTICTKLSRIMHGNPNERDHWHDIAGYATLVEMDLQSSRVQVPSTTLQAEIDAAVRTGANVFGNDPK